MATKITNAVRRLYRQQFGSLIIMAICLVCTTNAYGQLSYTYGWESSGLGNWNSAGSTADEFESSQLNPCSGSGSAVANAYDDGYALLTSPDLGASNGGVITLGYSYKVVNFDDETIGAPADQVLIEVQQAFASSGPWITVQTINSSNHIVSASCAPQTVMFTPQPGNFFLRFKCTAVGGSADLLYYIDEVSLSQGPAPDCAGPANLMLAALTPMSASISFTASASAPANGYDYYVSTTNTAPAGTTSATGNSAASPVQISGLMSSTTYYVWLRAKCSATVQSAWNGPLSFTTPCPPVSVPYEQQFEGTTPPAIPNCTSNQNAGTGNDWVVAPSPNSGGFTTAGGQILFYNFHPSSAANAWWYSQGISLTAGNNYVISYKYGNSNSSTERMKVAYGTIANAGSMTSLLADHPDISQAAAQVNTVYFSPAASGVYYFGFNAYSNIYESRLYLDSIKVDMAPSCIPVTGLSAVTAPMSASVSFSPSMSNPAGGYDYYLSTTNMAPGSTTTPTGNSATSPIALSGLTPATTYYIWVRSNCTTSDQSTWSGLSFTTKIANDDATGAITIVVNQACTGNPFTNKDATRASGEPFPGCVGTMGYAVAWYKFTAPLSGAVKISCDGTGGTIGNTKMALFSVTDPADYSTFTILGCDNDNGVQTGNRSLFYSFGLTPGATYYIAMDVFSSTQLKGTFCLTVDEFSADMLSSATGDCQASQNGSGSNIRSSYQGWTSIVDNAGNLIANVKGMSSSSTQSFATQLTVKTGGLRADVDGTEYMNRNFLITGTNTSSAEVQMFFTQDELTAMGGDIAALRVTRVSGNTCAANFQDGTGANTLLTPTANGAAGSIHYIQFTTPGFSNFYIMKGSVPLPITFEYFKGSKTGATNRLDWKLNNSEPGIASMVLERSEDGERFTALQEQKISGRDESVFTYTDRSMKAMVNYYRVRLTGESGRQLYSRIVTLANAGPGYQDVSMAPNPVRNSALLQIAAAQNGRIIITVSDIVGKVLAKKEVNVEEGTNDINLDLSYLNAGTYQLLVTGNTGASRTLRFVKY